jgi:hypothetical protein
MSQVHQVFQKFSQDHPEDFVDGKLKVCIGGGAGFIGSHIAKALRQEVSDFISMILMVLL